MNQQNKIEYLRKGQLFQENWNMNEILRFVLNEEGYNPIGEGQRNFKETKIRQNTKNKSFL